MQERIAESLEKLSGVVDPVAGRAALDEALTILERLKRGSGFYWETNELLPAVKEKLVGLPRTGE
jgi:hypothetical protein